MSTRSPSGTSSPVTGSRLLDTGVLSPVSPASSISSVAATRIRPSAGTLSPASKPTMSPGTSSSAGISTRWPSRRTFAVMISICRSAATLSAALPSWCRPITALSTVRPRTTDPGRDVLQGDDADDRRADQHQLHEVAVLAQEGLPARLLGLLGQLVRTVPLPTLGNLGGAQTGRRIDVQPATDLVGRQAVPIDVLVGRRRWCSRLRS